ncbi:hypothetical protein MHU86_21478 [Fragilaria crotonensis]|nr:hypothetical protein MHU86_21478 [Fragilaria crotonensis]
MMSIATTIPATASKDMTYIHRVLMAKDFVEIEVDIESPERNREAQVFHFTGRRTNGKLHNGFTIEMCVDPRDYTNHHYQAYLLPDKHRIFIKVPSQCASFTLDHALVSGRERANFCDRVQESRDVARHAIQDSDKRVYKHMVLMFPGYMELSNAIYSPTTADGKIRMVPVPYEGSVTLGGTEYPTLLCRVVWKVHIVEATDRVVEREHLNEGTYEDELVQALREGLETNYEQYISSRQQWPTHQTVAASSTVLNNQYAAVQALGADDTPPASIVNLACPPTKLPVMAFADGRFILSPQYSAPPPASIVDHAHSPTSLANMPRADERFHQKEESALPAASIFDPARAVARAPSARTVAWADERFHLSPQKPALQQHAVHPPSFPQAATAPIFDSAQRLTRTMQAGAEGAPPDVLMDDEGGHLKRTYTDALDESDLYPDVDV